MRDTDGKNIYEACLHREACIRIAKSRAPIYGTPWESLGCCGCEEWEDEFCPMRLAGTMRCDEKCERS